MHYSGKIIIHNESTINFDNKNKYFLLCKFSISFNNKKLYLNNGFIKQLLESNSVRNYLIDEVKEYILLNKDTLIDNSKNILTLENKSYVSIKAIGKYLYVYITATRDNNIDEYIKSFSNKIKRKIDKIELLRG